MGVAVDELQVGQAPVAQQLWPRQVAMLFEHLKERQLMVDFGGLEQALAAFPAAPLLQPAQQPHLVARRAPEIPGGHTGRVPARFGISASGPEVDMPAEPVDRLAADAAEAATACVGALPIGCWRQPEALRQVAGAAL